MNISPSLKLSLDQSAPKGGHQGEPQTLEGAIALSPHATTAEHSQFEKQLNPFLSSPKQSLEKDDNEQETKAPSETDLANTPTQLAPRIAPTDSHPLPRSSIHASSEESWNRALLPDDSNQTENPQLSPSASHHFNSDATKTPIRPQQLAVPAGTHSPLSPSQPIPDLQQTPSQPKLQPQPESQTQATRKLSAPDKALPSLETDTTQSVTTKTTPVQTERVPPSNSHGENPAAIESSIRQELLTRDQRSQIAQSNKSQEHQQNGTNNAIQEPESRPGIPSAQSRGERLEPAPKARANSKMETKAQKSNHQGTQVAQTESANQVGQFASPNIS
jgi:hypothetical protein